MTTEMTLWFVIATGTALLTYLFVLIRLQHKKVKRLQERLRFIGRPHKIMVIARSHDDYHEFVQGQHALFPQVQFREAVVSSQMLGWHGPVIMTPYFVEKGAFVPEEHERMLELKRIIESSYYGLEA